MGFSFSDLRYRARMRLNFRSRRLIPVGLLTILVGALIVTACGGGSESCDTGASVPEKTNHCAYTDPH